MKYSLSIHGLGEIPSLTSATYPMLSANTQDRSSAQLRSEKSPAVLSEGLILGPLSGLDYSMGHPVTDPTIHPP